MLWPIDLINSVDKTRFSCLNEPGYVFAVILVFVPVQQVLVSIQGMMFTPDPCFNEPGYEGIRGTDEGDVSNKSPMNIQEKPQISFCKYR